MTELSSVKAMPFGLSLKRYLMVHGGRLWWAVNPRLVSLAPIYVFPDQDRFNSDEVEQLARQNLSGALRLPHASCIFEVPEHNHPGACLASYTLDSPTGIESGFFRFCPVERRWSDLLAQVSFLGDGSAEASAHPRVVDPDLRHTYIEVASSMVWRALGVLAVPTLIAEQRLSRLRRAPFAKAGVRDWIYRVADIRPTSLNAALADGQGSHAPPRWHIRRGHWRQLADGRRVFVRECQVGDPSRGGVIKDYHVQVGEAA